MSARQQAVRHLDAAVAALECGDRDAAARQYAEAGEILFREARECTVVDTKVALAKRAQRILDAALALSGQSGDVAAAPAGSSMPRVRSSIMFADVAGLEDVKETLHLRLIYPLKHPEKVSKYGLRSGGGMLLFGPPGTGKTMIAKAVAGELDLPFFAVKPSDILGSYVGESERKLAELFNEARSQTAGAVVFIDEIDAIGGARGRSDQESSRRLLTQLLQELDGVQGRPAGLLFLAATNEPWLLDDALLRPGRFDDKCLIPLPDEAARMTLMRLQLRDVPLANDIDWNKLAARTERFSGADLMCLCERAKQIPFREAVLGGVERPLSLADFEQSLKTVRPSIAEDRIRQYLEYAAA